MADKAKQTIVTLAVCFFKSEDFQNYIWENDYIIREEDFLQYDLNCQSQLLALY